MDINYAPQTDDDFIECLKHKNWRLNNLYYVKNKQGQIVPFKLNSMQLKIVNCPHNRAIILKTRQIGVSTLKIIDSIDDALFMPNRTNGVMAQGLDEAAEMLEKARLAWNMLNVSVKRYLGLVYQNQGFKMEKENSDSYNGPILTLATDNTTEFGFSNGSKLMVRTSFRSGTLQMLHVSELGKISAKDPKKAYELKTGTFQAIGDNRRVTVESTAEGKSGYFYELWNNAEAMLLSKQEFSCLDFYPIFIGWTEDPDCVLYTPKPITEENEKYFKSIEDKLQMKLRNEQKWFYINKLAELGDHITQEYPATPEEAFRAARDGFIYGHSMTSLRNRNGIVSNLYDPNLPVFAAMDLGMRDLFVFVFWQQYEGENRIIAEYANKDMGIDHYVDYLFRTNYKFKRIFGPHDLQKRDLMYQQGQTRQKILADKGVHVDILPNIPVEDGIQAVKSMLQCTLIDSKCEYLISCLDNYSRSWDESLGNWRKEPIHNRYSHGADALRYMAISANVYFPNADIKERPKLIQRSSTLRHVGRYDV